VKINVNRKTIKIISGKGFRIHSLKIIFFVWVIFFSSKVYSQDSLLTLDQAIKIAVENNFDVKIVSNIAKQKQNDNTAGKRRHASRC
jgi:hypothetical protein